MLPAQLSPFLGDLSMGKINWEQPHVPGVCVTPGRCTWLCGGFSLLPPFLLSFLLLFSSPQSKQASPCPIWLMNPEISPALVITRDRWPGEIPGGCSPARGSHRELQLTDFAPGHPKGWQQLFPTFQAVGCGGIHGGIHGGITPWWSPRGLYSQCGTCSIPPSFSLLPLSSAVCLAGNKKKKKKSSFPSFFPLSVLRWVQHRSSGWHKGTHLSGGALSTPEQGFSRACGVPAPRFLGGWRPWGTGGSRAGSGSTIFVPLSGTVFSLSAPACFLCWGLIHTR